MVLPLLLAGAHASLWTDPRCIIARWPDTEVTRENDGRLLTVAADGLRESWDEGKTWRSVSEIAEGDPPQKVERRYAFPLVTRAGVLVVVYIDPISAAWKWDDRLRRATIARRNVWSIRSVDGGKTWESRTMVSEGYCGYLSGGSFLELPSGRIVVPVQHWLDEETRHAGTVCFSDDAGMTWRKGSLVDLGGRGHHDGAMEAAMVRKNDGRLWMLTRTNLDSLWQSYSADEGETWSKPIPTRIDASSSPCAIKRLRDRSLLLVWNRLYPEGRSDIKRKPADGNYATSHAASGHREELSVSRSFDDGATWTDPKVVARMPDGRICYPRIFEKAPGEVLVTAVVGPPNRFVTFRFDPADFDEDVAAKAK